MYPPKPSPQVSESVPEEVRKWLASTFAKQEQVINIDADDDYDDDDDDQDIYADDVDDSDNYDDDDNNWESVGIG